MYVIFKTKQNPYQLWNKNRNKTLECEYKSYVKVLDKMIADAKYKFDVQL